MSQHCSQYGYQAFLSKLCCYLRLIWGRGNFLHCFGGLSHTRLLWCNHSVQPEQTPWKWSWAGAGQQLCVFDTLIFYRAMSIYRTPLNIANAFWFHEVTTWQPSAPLSPPLTHLTYKMSNVVICQMCKLTASSKRADTTFLSSETP